MTSDELALIRQHDYWAADCSECQMDAHMSHHGVAEPGCPAPSDHHAYVKGTPSDETERDVRALLEYVDELRAMVAGPLIAELGRR